MLDNQGGPSNESTSLASSQQVEIPRHVRSVIDAEGAVLLDLQQGKYFSLNHSAATIWRTLEDGLTIDEVQAHLSAAYGTSLDRSATDVTRFIRMLEERRLLNVAR